MDCSPVEVPRSVGDNRFMAHCAVQWPNIRFVGFEANEWLHDVDRMIAFIGGAQIDPYGNVTLHVSSVKATMFSRQHVSQVPAELTVSLHSVTQSS